MTNHDYGRREVLATAAALAAAGTTTVGSASAASGEATAAGSASNWNQWTFDGGGTRYDSSVDPPAANLTQQSELEVGGQVLSVADEDRVYAAGQRLVAATHDGSVAWEADVPSGAQQWSLPGIDGDTLYASVSDQGLYAFDAATGDGRWQYELENYGGLFIIDADGVLVFQQAGANQEEGTVVALDDAGEQRWETSVAGQGIGVIAGDGVFVTTDSGMVALDRESGDQLWSHEATADAFAFFPVATENRVYYGDQQYTYGLDPASGEPQWRAEATLPLYPILTDDRLLAYRDQQLLALDPESGEVTTEYGDLQVTPLAAGGDVLYGANFEGQFGAYSLTEGEQVGQYDLGGGAGFPVLRDDRIYVGDDNGMLQVIVEGDATDGSDGSDADGDGSEGGSDADGGDDGTDGDGSEGDSGSQDGSEDDGGSQDGSDSDAEDGGDTDGDDGADSDGEDGSDSDGSGGGDSEGSDGGDSGSESEDGQDGDGSGGGSDGEDGNDQETDDGGGDDGSGDGGGNSIPGFGAVATLAGLGSVAGWLANRDDDADAPDH